MSVLASARTPAGNIIELHHEAGRFTSVVYTPEEPRELTVEQAEDLYRLTGQLDGKQHERFPWGAP